MRRRGFTLIELLTVLMILSLLAALLMPAVQHARESARKASCQNNLKQLGLALQNYESSFRVFPPGSVLGGWSWRTLILPQLDQGALYSRINFGNNVLSPPGIYGCSPESDRLFTIEPSWQSGVVTFRCPSDPRAVDIYTGYRGVSGNEGLGMLLPSMKPGDPLPPSGNGMLSFCSRVKPGNVTDGTSSTLFIGETGSQGANFCGSNTGERDAWMTVAGGLRLGIFDDSETSHYWSWHPYGALFGFVDGHVQFLNYSMDRSTFWKMGSRSGGEVLGEF